MLVSFVSPTVLWLLAAGLTSVSSIGDQSFGSSVLGLQRRSRHHDISLKQRADHQKRVVQWTLKADRDLMVSPMQLQVVDQNSILVIDKYEKNPGRVAGHSAFMQWLNLATGATVYPDSISNSFCAGGSYLGNGTLLNIGGDKNTTIDSYNGIQGLRFFPKCDDTGCSILEWPELVKLTSPRWYPTSATVSDGSVFVAGGTKKGAFMNTLATDNPTYEFYPRKGNGKAIYSLFLHDALFANLFPIMWTVPGDLIFMVANTKAMLYDWKNNKEIRLPDLPDGVRTTYPYGAAAALLPMTIANKFVPEVIICGGSTVDDRLPANKQSSQTPAVDKCFRITATTAIGPRGWYTERQTMITPRIMGDAVLLPTGLVVIVNGAQTGAQGFGNLPDSKGCGKSNADHPAFRGLTYDPTAGQGKRLSSDQMPTSNIARMYHSVATLLPSGEIYIAGSNPSQDVQCINDSAQYGTEYRTERLSPDYMTAVRPTISRVPTRMDYKRSYRLTINSLPSGTTTVDYKVVLMDLGFHTHGVSMNQRLVEMRITASSSTNITFTAPGDGSTFPPGPAWLFFLVKGVPAIGVKTLMGSGANPPQV